MESMKLEYLLEILSEEIWIRQAEPQQRRNPSLQERRELVGTFLQAAVVQENQIVFSGEAIYQKDFPAYPYILLEEICDITDEESPQRVRTWKISGFEKFSELQEYVYQADSLFFSVFIKENHVYRKAEPMFYIKDKEDRVLPTDIWGYRFSWGYPEGNYDFERNLDLEHGFTLYGLCEFQLEKGVICAIVNSLDDMMQFMDGLLLEIMMKKPEEALKVSRGTVYYNGETYTYEFETGDMGVGYQLFDQEGKRYCTVRHAFVDGIYCEKIADCQDCMKIFNLQTEVSVMEAICEKADLD